MSTGKDTSKSARTFSVGVTTVQDMTASGTELRAYQILRARGEPSAAILVPLADLQIQGRVLAVLRKYR